MAQGVAFETKEAKSKLQTLEEAQSRRRRRPP